MANTSAYLSLAQRIRELELSEMKHKQAEETPSPSETKLYDAQKLAGLGYWRWDVNTGEVIGSAEGYKIFKKTRPISIRPSSPCLPSRRGRKTINEAGS